MERIEATLLIFRFPSGRQLFKRFFLPVFLYPCVAYEVTHENQAPTYTILGSDESQTPLSKSSKVELSNLNSCQHPF